MRNHPEVEYELPPSCKNVTPCRLSQGRPQSHCSIEALGQYAARAKKAGRWSVALTVASDTGVGAPDASGDPRLMPKSGAARASGVKENERRENASMVDVKSGKKERRMRKKAKMKRKRRERWATE